MGAPFWRLLYGEEPRDFVSAFGIDESVERLGAATGRSVLSSLTSQMAVGKVTESRVALQRAIPMVGNSFKPFFIGSFVRDGDRVLLRGRFTMSRATKVFMSIWFGFIGLWTVIALLGLLAPNPAPWWFPLAGLGMLGAGVALVRAGKWFARNDAAWLSEVIQDALSGKGPRYK